jgi:FAD/FMN-containing dehydrogenase
MLAPAAARLIASQISRRPTPLASPAMGSLTRRELLALAGGASIAAVAVEPLDAFGRASPTAGLARRLHGTLVLPRQPAYPAARRLFNPRLEISPRAIAFCESQHDIAAVIGFARSTGWPIAARSGRHSFAGYSNTTGIVADVSRLDHVLFDPATATVRIGAGANIQDVYERLVIPHGVAIPLGTCPTVGLGGLTLGGGFGHLMRKAGLLADSLLALNVVLADGSVVRATPTSAADLFWASQGGGGGNFGIVSEFTFAVQPTSPVTTFGLSFDWSLAADALDAWQRTVPQLPGAVSYSTFRATRTPATGGAYKLSATVGGHFYGDEATLRGMLAPLLALNPLRTTINALPFVVAALPDGCTRATTGLVSCAAPEYPNYQRSDFVDAPLPTAGIQTLLGQIERWPGGPGADEGGVQIEALGDCAVNRVGARATAFVHRDSLFHIVYLNFWGPADTPAVAGANVAWAKEIYAAMRPYVSGYAYQNYIDAGLSDWGHAYYGVNYPRLQQVKARYDPHDLFRFAQGITPA